MADRLLALAEGRSPSRRAGHAPRRPLAAALLVLGSSRPPTSCSAACERRQDGRGGDGAGYAGEGGRDDARAEDGGCAAARDDARGVVALLRPTQAVHFLAAAKLHLAVHEFFFFFVTSQCMNSGATRMGAPATPQP